MAIDCLWSTHKRRWNTEAETQTQDAETQMLEHRCWNTETAETLNTQMLEHRR
jgi:hypothetical protein